ncbi:unnamed protein product [Cylicocyclus nassatus]|nr:unnamed protein product [Cylicocyclus nassatus]
MEANTMLNAELDGKTEEVNSLNSYIGGKATDVSGYADDIDGIRERVDAVNAKVENLEGANVVPNAAYVDENGELHGKAIVYNTLKTDANGKRYDVIEGQFIYAPGKAENEDTEVHANLEACLTAHGLTAVEA